MKTINLSIHFPWVTQLVPGAMLVHMNSQKRWRFKDLLSVAHVWRVKLAVFNVHTSESLCASVSILDLSRTSIAIGIIGNSMWILQYTDNKFYLLIQFTLRITRPVAIPLPTWKYSYSDKIVWTSSRSKIKVDKIKARKKNRHSNSSKIAEILKHFITFPVFMSRSTVSETQKSCTLLIAVSVKLSTLSLK